MANNFQDEALGKRYMDKYGDKEKGISKNISKEDILYAHGVMKNITGVIDHLHYIFGPDEEFVDELQLLEIFINGMRAATPEKNNGVTLKPILKDIFSNMELDIVGWENEYKLIEDAIWDGDTDGV